VAGAGTGSGLAGARPGTAVEAVVVAAVDIEVGPAAVVAGIGAVVVGLGPGTAAGPGAVAPGTAVEVAVSGPGIEGLPAAAALAVGSLALYMPGRCGSTTGSIAVHSSKGSHKLDICSSSHPP
jgi:hypothetical protein